MKITRAALRHIRSLRSRQRIARGAGLRLGLRDRRLCLRWEPAAPTPEDLVVMRRDLPIIIDAQTYLHLADFELDFRRGKGPGRFLLQRRHTL